MATSIANAHPLEWAGSSDGTQPVVKLYREGSSETFAKGDLVIFDQSESGLVVVAQGDGGVYGDSDNDESADTTNFLGIALKAASGTAGTLIDVLIPRPQDYFAATLFATDNTTVVAPDEDNIGQILDLIKGDSNNNSATGVLEENTGGGGTWVKVVDLDRQGTTFRGGTIGGEPTYAVGDRVIVRFQESALDGTGAQA